VPDCVPSGEQTRPMRVLRRVIPCALVKRKLNLCQRYELYGHEDAAVVAPFDLFSSHVMSMGVGGRGLTLSR
jgi:hypothetical protein